MSPIGPALPPHLAQKPSPDSESESDSEELGPSPPPASSSKSSRNVSQAAHKPAVGPSLRSLPSSALDPQDSNPHSTSKPKRVAGPTLPPASLDQRPPESPSHSDSDSDGYGPALPSAQPQHPSDTAPSNTVHLEPKESESVSKQSSRAEWMTLPPSSSSLNFDPSRQRARGFNTKPSSGKSASTGLAAQWTETPEEKKRRLANEVLGIGSATSSAVLGSKSEKSSKLKEAQDGATASRLSKRRNEESLMETHQKKHRKNAEAHDDPSKRGFDWEKDMNSIGKGAGGKQTKQMMNKAASELKSRFTGGSFS